ncbi:MAG: radical SAM protein [Thermoproteota archaeon]|nr:MAG: radical SAM protein [Candidatus Korarchaeota archaeon]
MNQGQAAEPLIMVSGKSIKIGGPLPELREGEQPIRKTASICPVCYRLLPAIIFEREGKAFLRRICPEHGEIEESYWADAEYLRRALKYETVGVKVSKNVETRAPCPFSCGLCSMHRNTTALANLVVTNRCDFSCWYCFFYAEKAGYVYEPTIEEIREMIRVLRSQRPAIPNAVQITGGEPLLREDLVEIVKVLREEGITHVQLNTNGIRLAYNVELMAKLRRAGVNTLYLSFDAVDPKINVKNHWEIPYILENARKTRTTSIVLVPTVIKGWNDHELGRIIKFASLNIDIIRGVNFQPISIVGQVPREKRKEVRITIPEVIKAIEEQTDGQIPMDAWYPVPFVSVLSDFVEALTGNPIIRFSNHPACGMATYVFPELEVIDGHKRLKRLIPITEFVDVTGLYEYLKEKTEELRSGANKKWILAKFIARLPRFIDRKNQPKGLNLIRLLADIFIRRNYDALGKFHDMSLFLGMMHFMDPYNYDVQRVMRCNIHYLSPDGRIIPFCAYNVLPDLYRDYIIKNHSMSLEDYAKMFGRDKVGEAIKYKRDIEALTSSEIYRKTYAPFLKL